MHQPQPEFTPEIPAARALALGLVTGTDLLRLKVIARVHARGLPPEIHWSDLLQEAFARVLDGSRRQPADVPMVAFLGGVMRSIKAEYWRRARKAERQLAKLLAHQESGGPDELEPCDPAPDPERRLIAIEELARIEQLFADDPEALRIIAGLAAGDSPEEIRTSSGMSKTDYDSTRKRMRRILLREGLRLMQP